MAVDTTNAIDGPFAANGVTTVFPFTFTALSSGDVAVFSRSASGVDTPIASGFSVTIEAGGGGAVTFDTPPPSGSIFIYLNPDMTRTTDFAQGGAYLARAHNAGFDRDLLRAQALRRDLDRTIRTPMGEAGVQLPVAAARAGGFLAFDPSGAPVRSAGTGADAGLRTDLVGPDGAKWIGFSYSGTFGAGTIGKSLQNRDVNVADAPFNATANGTTDDTAAFQAAHDALPNGGTISVTRPGTYRVNMVNITNRNITVRLAAGVTIKKFGNAGVAVRGVFKVANLLNAGFVLDLNGGTFDLNGEGPTGIGVAGRIPNNYAAKTVASLICIAGPTNAALYALRSTGIKVKGPGKIKNTGEVGILLRNCGDCDVDGVDFENITDWGVEIGTVAAANDQGTGPMPARNNMRVRNCTFTDINDFGASSGNGGGIGGGGTSVDGALYDYSFVNNEFLRCYRDIHFELVTGTWIQGGVVDGVKSKDAGQGSIGGIGVRGWHYNNISIVNPGWATVLALTYQVRLAAGDPFNTYPESTGMVFSSDFEDITLGDNITITDERAGGVVYRTDGVATAGSTTFTSAGASFAANDVGKPIGIIGAGPAGGTVIHETFIAARNSATSIELERPAITSKASAKFAYGGGVRDPILLQSGTGATIGNVTIKGGSQFGMVSEPASGAIRLKDLSGLVKIADPKLTAGTNGTSHSAGIRIQVDSGFPGAVKPAGPIRASGYEAVVVGHSPARFKPPEVLIIPIGDETTAISAGNGKATYRMPFAFTLLEVRASVTTAPATQALVIDINEAGATLLSTKLTIAAGQKTSTTAAAAVISDANLAEDAEITIDFDQVGTGTTGAGVKVYLMGMKQ